MNNLYAGILIFLVSIACSLALLSSNLERWRKLLVVAAICLSGLMSYRLLNEVYGLPALLNENYEDIWVHSYHPSPDDGWLYIWLRKDDANTPISYKVPYSEKLHKKLEANFKQTKGKPYRGSLNTVIQPFNRFEESVEEIDVNILNTFPSKENP